jgi:hypothetical protein
MAMKHWVTAGIVGAATGVLTVLFCCVPLLLQRVTWVASSPADFLRALLAGALVGPACGIFFFACTKSLSRIDLWAAIVFVVYALSFPHDPPNVAPFLDQILVRILILIALGRWYARSVAWFVQQIGCHTDSLVAPAGLEREAGLGQNGNAPVAS